MENSDLSVFSRDFSPEDVETLVVITVSQIRAELQSRDLQVGNPYKKTKEWWLQNQLTSDNPGEKDRDLAMARRFDEMVKRRSELSGILIGAARKRLRIA